MSKPASSETLDDPPALDVVHRFMIGGQGASPNAPSAVDRPSNDAAHEAASEVLPRAITIAPEVASENAKQPESSTKEQPARKPIRKAPDKRPDLPREPLNHRVRTDIFDRLDDERVYQRKQGSRVFLADIADEALHLGLLQMEKRRRK